MAKFLTQFYATPDELAQFVTDTLEEYGVHAIAEHSPFRTEAVTSNNASKALSQSSVWCVIFTETPAVLPATNEGELLDKNPGSLLLNIGKLSGRSLEESTLGTMIASPTWKRINSLLKGRTKAGMIGIQERTGGSAFYRNFRFTDGARALSEQGVALRPDAHSSIVLRPSDRPAKQ
jgi:hypothetical protein